MEWWRDNRNTYAYLGYDKYQCYTFAAFVFKIMLDMGTTTTTCNSTCNNNIQTSFLVNTYPDQWRMGSKDEVQPFTIFSEGPSSGASSPNHIGVIVAVNGDKVIIAETNGGTYNDVIGTSSGSGANLVYREANKSSLNHHQYAIPNNPQDAINRATEYMKKNGML
jgi:hypothetical protein